ncbi:MAG: putative lipid II flippase FtsW [Verrucomicrobiae bacterium]|nr:putative lipid II flippase FtsW [Verrucomicrobiae bacterium]MDW8310426.1 putative lipid II flippase FtsW [Verrucomicrobiales bacterium]
MKTVVTTLCCCVAALLSLGMVMLYSSSMTVAGAHYLKMQLIWCVLGLGVCVLVMALDARWLERAAWPLFGLSVLLLALVLVPGLGRRINGAQRWFDFGGVRFQPSELAKLGLILALAWYGARFQRHMTTLTRGVLLPGAMIAVPVGLIFVEPDRGTAILLAAVGGMMLLLAGARWRFIVPPALVAVAVLGWSLWHDPVRRERILAFLHPEQHREGAGYQVWQGVLALGSGGWFGTGLGNSRQKLGYVPERHTDFILPIIGEELGLVATLSVLLGFAVIFYCGAFVAWRASDPFGFLVASGASLLIALQACMNIGVVTASLPNKGIPLPFISYGGSNLVTMLACVGLVLNVARHRAGSEPARRSPFEAAEVPQSA